MAETYNTELAHKAQERYCKEKKYPHFAPRSKCYRCGKDIYRAIEHECRDWRTGNPIGEIYITGISVEKAGSTLITGCPHCNYSFCE